MTKYRRLQRDDIAAFDSTATDLVMEATDHGWVGRVTKRGHAVMRSPDGKWSMTLSRDSLRGRSGRNARSYFERWLNREEER